MSLVAWIGLQPHAGGRISTVSHAIRSPLAVFFDLDGTLVDPAGGITGGIAHALREAGMQVPPESVLSELVGPPLAMGLRETVGVPENLLDDVIAGYRSWYGSEGMALSSVYPGIVEALDALRAAGVRLAVTTSKPQPLAIRLLTHHGLAARFETIAGSSPDETAPSSDHGASGSKEPIVLRAARTLGVDPSRCAVVGDRRFDMEAAVATGARAIGAGWGFAPGDELTRSGADVIVSQPRHLAMTLLEEDAA